MLWKMGRNWNYRIVFYCVNCARIPRSWQACKKVTSPAELWIIKIIFRDPPNKLQSSDRGLVQVRLQQSSCVGIYWQSTFAVVWERECVERRSSRLGLLGQQSCGPWCKMHYRTEVTVQRWLVYLKAFSLFVLICCFHKSFIAWTTRKMILFNI